MARGLRGHGRSSRYSGYTGGPDPLAPPVDLRDALEAIGQDVMEGSSPRRALQELLRRGTQDMRGSDKLAAEANRRRRELLQRNNLDGTLQEIKKLLDEAVLAERKELARALDDDARFNEMRIESLPPSPAKAVQELSDYDWRSQEAREKYDQIKDLMGREMLDQRFAGMKQAMENATDEDRQRVNDMLDDLNDLLDKHARGEDSKQDFDDFMKKHGEFFPENPKNVDELLDSLAQRAAAAQRFRNSLSPDQRAELDALAQQAFGSPSLMNALNRLDGHLQAARPGEDWTGSSKFSGDNPMGMGEGAQAMQDIAELEQLAETLSQSYAGATMDDVDLEMLARQLGDEAAVDARTLSELEKALMDQGSWTAGPTGSGGCRRRRCRVDRRRRCVGSGADLGREGPVPRVTGLHRGRERARVAGPVARRRRRPLPRRVRPGAGPARRPAPPPVQRGLRPRRTGRLAPDGAAVRRGLPPRRGLTPHRTGRYGLKVRSAVT